MCVGILCISNQFGCIGIDFLFIKINILNKIRDNWIGISMVIILYNIITITASLSFMGSMMNEDKKLISVYPIFLFYLFLSWFCLFIWFIFQTTFIKIQNVFLPRSTNFKSTRTATIKREEEWWKTLINTKIFIESPYTSTLRISGY